MGPLRNITFIKAIAIGFSVAALGGVLTDTLWPPMAAIALVVVVASDAMLCDIPDIAYDNACGCTTIPSIAPESTVWIIAFAANVLAACFLWFLCDSNIGLIILALFPPLFLVRKFDIRFFVDLRLPIVAVIAWVV